MLQKLFQLLLTLSVASAAQAQQYQFQTFSVGDGLAQSQVFALLEDSKGFLWMGTRGGGVSRFDGERFESFTVADGLPSNYIWSFATDGDGQVWIGTERGLCLFQKGAIDSLRYRGFNKPVTSLHFHDQQLWIGTPDGLYVEHQKSKQNITPWENSPKALIMAIECADSAAQNLLFGGDAGLAEKGGQAVSGLNSNLVRALARDKKGGVWIGSYGGGVNYLMHDSVSNPSTQLGLEETRIHDIYIAKDGLVWIATQQRGICRFHPSDSTVEFITEAQGLANNHVRCITEDRWGNIWIGTSGGGVSKYTGQQFTYFTQQSGLPGAYIYAIAEDDQDRLLVASSGRGISQLQSDGFAVDSLLNDLPSFNAKALYKDSDCRIWIGFDGGGIAVVDTDTVHILNTNKGLGGNYVRDIIEDADGSYWVALAGGGIDKLRRDTNGTYLIRHLGRNEGLTSTRVNQLLLDEQGRIWFVATSGGVGYLLNDTVRQVWNGQRGMPSNDMTSICQDRAGKLWVGSAGGGITRISMQGDSASIQVFSTSEGLSSNVCYFVACDVRNQLWVGSEKGVDRLQLDAESAVIEVDHFGLDEGFRGVETTLNSVYQDIHGHLWFGTINGLIQYRGASEERLPALPLLFFDQTTVNGGPLDVPVLSPILSHDSNMLGFSFRAISQWKPRDIRYQWRLEGLENEWSEPTINNSVTYSNLKPGQYTFLVRAGLQDGRWTEALSGRFTIRKPYWEELWFLVVSIGGGSLLLALFVFWRIRAFRLHSLEQQQQLRLENEVLELEQRALRLQMNPHFIFNALNSIQAMISTNDPKTARYYLAKFSKLMRQTLDNSRNKEIPLEREIATLENYLSIERFCHNERFDFEINVDDALDVEEVTLPPILVQPFVENAIVHGVSQMQGKGRISVRFRSKDNFLVCEIEDNGIGREAASKQKSQQDQGHKSQALIITQERLDNLNLTDDKSSIQIHDLKNEHGESSGTNVVLFVTMK